METWEIHAMWGKNAKGEGLWGGLHQVLRKGLLEFLTP